MTSIESLGRSYLRFWRLQGSSPARVQWPGDKDYAGIDIFRFDDDGKIIQHWDVLQVVTGDSKNDNGLF